MPPTRRPDDDDTSDLYDDTDDEGPSRDDLERFGGEFRACPECGDDVYDQAPICPTCGHAFSNQPAASPVWIIVTAVTVIAALLVVFVLF